MTDFIDSIQFFDLLFVVFLFGLFVLGYVQGVIRRLLGILTMTFSFVLAANLRQPVGDFLARNWTQFPADYSRMIGFGVIFAALAITFALASQVYYKPVSLWPRTPWLEDVTGGLLGLVLGMVLMLAMVTITDPYFRGSSMPASNELPLLRGFHDSLSGSAVHSLFRDVLIPGFNVVFGVFMPDQVKSAFPGLSS